MNRRKPAPGTGRQGAANRLLALSWFAVALAGCQSRQFTYYIAPRITGRVVAAETHQPIADARVRLLLPGAVPGVVEPPKGGQVLVEIRPALTDADGRFELPSQSNVGLFRHAGWWSVAVSFEKSGFQLFQTNYTLANSTNSASGEPLVIAGDILLQPAVR